MKIIIIILLFILGIESYFFYKSEKAHDRTYNVLRTCYTTVQEESKKNIVELTVYLGLLEKISAELDKDTAQTKTYIEGLICDFLPLTAHTLKVAQALNNKQATELPAENLRHVYESNMARCATP